ncbi:MAG TPA: aldolase/citrate lyase family protein [Pyrinomonadaceae bacterium]
MKQTFSNKILTEIYAKLENPNLISDLQPSIARNPVHVVYGGAHLFTAETPRKLGKIALRSVETYAPNFAEFARAVWLAGADALPQFDDAAQNLEFELTENAEKVKSENLAAWLAWTVFNRVIEKLRTEAVEDFRIDFEDGYGFRPDEEEDAHCVSASDALAQSFREKTITPFCGFRVKSFQFETLRRAVRSLDLFLTNLLGKTDGVLPENFVVTLPKITRKEEVENLDRLLSEFEKRNNLEKGIIKIEVMIETPQSIINESGAINLRNLIEAGNGRVNSAHFGAYDYTASFGISGVHQHLQHEACVFARQMMQISLAPLNIRLADSVTIELPVPIHKGESLSEHERRENKRAVQAAWRKHFNNVTNSLINGFYQSWDLHPAQIPARYAAVYAFFLTSSDAQSKRLKGFIEKATQANLTGNTFDDAASAQGLLNFFLRGLNCGAMTEAEITEKTGLKASDLQAASFAKIVEKARTEK